MAAVVPRGRARRRYKTAVRTEPEKVTAPLPILELEIPPRDETVHSYTTEVRNAAEFAAQEVKKLLDFMEAEDALKKRRRRKAAYLLLLN